MAGKTIRFELHQGQRRLVLEGDIDELQSLIDEYASWVQDDSGVPVTSLSAGGISGGSSSAPPSKPPALPEGGAAGLSFGEFIHPFASDITDVDRALIAAVYAQQQSEDSTFATNDVSELLKEQGIRLSNPSMSIRRNMVAKRIFSMSKGKYRVSREGLAHLEALHRD